ncbi:MAG: ATP-dependent zinc metalloprotease FtsH [Ardenticatenaceae bacterium]|nr:ATP-dependent zinc metalloprotease FtsH [Ardenticatenaceae bacterium]MCB9445219.1 ATP-dependent zinc metalloprotease FtsH [Ardenticatenaceae bacterium]
MQANKFITLFPAEVGDPNLLPLLEANNVLVDTAPVPTPWFTILLTDGLPILLLVLLFAYMGRNMTRGQGSIFNFSRSQVRTQTVGDHPDVTFDDVAGADEAKADLQEIVNFLRQPQQYYELGARIPRGVLLVGPPGTGKTLMARAVAGEAGVPFFHLSASEFVEMFVGVGASRVRDLFKQAKAAGAAIIFIDELDAVGRRRGAGLGAVNDEREQTLNQLLVEMDGFDERNEVILLAATNRPDVLDPALLRPGRFDRQVVVNLPDRPGREGILRIHTRKLRLADDVSLDTLARASVGMSGADLANLCNEAALVAARHGHHAVQMEDFEAALDKIMLGGERPLLLSEEDRRVIAYHEAGHAVVAWHLPHADPVHKVTIIPHGRALGVTEQLPQEDHYNVSRAYLLERLAVMLGGRTAEEIVIGDITTGAENDLVQATRLARRMVSRWGMSQIGLAAFDDDEENPFLGYEIAQGHHYSQDTAARIDQEVQTLLEERHQIARQILLEIRSQLDELVDLLLQKETVDQNQLAGILGPRPTITKESMGLSTELSL